MSRKFDLLKILAALIVLCGITYFYLNIISPKYLPNFLKLAVIEKPLNILILGTDITFDSETGRSTHEVGRTDTIMLLHYDPFNEKAFVLSVPRDTYVEIPGYRSTKINAAYVVGRIGLTKETVEKLTGVKIDRYLIVNTEGIVKIIDLLGGIKIDIEKDMYYTDKAQKLYIDLKKGERKLSGKEAEGYIRFRHDPLGDIGRIERQQHFLKALTGALSSPNAFLKSPFIFGLTQKNIKTDLSLKELILLANTFRQMKVKEIKTESIPGESGFNEAGSVWLINRKELSGIISRHF